MFAAVRAHVSQRHFYFCFSSCRKCGTLTAGCTDARSLLSEYLPLIWSIFGAAYTHTHTLLSWKPSSVFFPPFLFKKKNTSTFFFPLQFNFPSSLLFAFHSCDRQLGFPLSHSHTLSHASFFSLSLSLILWLFAEVSQSLGEPRGTAESAVPAPSQGGIEG